jgi:hypothetical protein
MEQRLNPDFHGTDDQLEAYALGQLATSDPPELEMLEEHLMVCSTCRDRLDGVEAFTSGMKDAFGPNSAIAISKQTELFSWLPWPRASFALAFLAVAAIIIAVFSRGQIQFAPVANLQLSATRGEMPVVAPARELDLTLSNAPVDGQSFRAVIVNATGRTVWSGQASQEARQEEGVASSLQVKARQLLEPGAYFLRLYGASGDVVREYGFRVRP